jgi:hypothetical protein
MKSRRIPLYLLFLVITTFAGSIPAQAQTACAGNPPDCISFLSFIRCEGSDGPPYLPGQTAVLHDTTANAFTEYPVVITQYTPPVFIYEGEARGLDTSHYYSARLRTRDGWIVDRWTDAARPPTQFSWTGGFSCQDRRTYLPIVYK